MNARSYRVDLNLSPLDFPAIIGLGESTVSYVSDVCIIKNKVLLMIGEAYIVHDMYNHKSHTVLTAQSIYEIPPNEIKSREDVYEFYNDALLGLSEAYQYVQSQMPELPSRSFHNEPIEKYKAEIDRVFNLLNSRN